MARRQRRRRQQTQRRHPHPAASHGRERRQIGLTALGLTRYVIADVSIIEHIFYLSRGAQKLADSAALHAWHRQQQSHVKLPAPTRSPTECKLLEIACTLRLQA